MKSSLQRDWPVVFCVVCVGFSLAWSFDTNSDLPQTEPQSQSATTDTAETREPGPSTLRSAEIIHVTAADFENQVLKSDIPVLVDFYADWCGPCKLQAPVLDELAREMHAVKIVKVNVDENDELVQRYRINSLPTLLVFKEAEDVHRHVGYASKKRLKKMLAEQ